MWLGSSSRCPEPHRAGYALFVRRGADAVGQVFTFDREQHIVAAFRSVRMPRMKQRTLVHLVRRADAGHGLPSPLLTPMMDGDAVRDGDAQDGNARDTGLRQPVRAVVQGTRGVNNIPAEKKVRPRPSARRARADV